MAPRTNLSVPLTFALPAEAFSPNSDKYCNFYYILSLHTSYKNEDNLLPDTTLPVFEDFPFLAPFFAFAKIKKYMLNKWTKN